MKGATKKAKKTTISLAAECLLRRFPWNFESQHTVSILKHLTKELVSTEAGETTQETDKGYDEISKLSSNDPQNFDQETNSDENIVTKGHKRKYEYDHVEDIRQPIKHWQVGEECQALSHKDGQ